MNLKKFSHYSLWIGSAMIVFVIVYGLCNHVASTRSDLFHLYFDWELKIPHIKPFMIAYRTLDVILVIVLFTLSSESIKRYSLAMMSSILMAAPIFIFIPTALGFPRLDNFDQFETLYRILYAVDKPHNLFPSMHVCYAAIGIWAMIREHSWKSKMLTPLLWLWLGLISASIVFVHQHHLIDIPGGLILAYINYKIFFKNALNLEFLNPVVVDPNNPKK